jgi:glutathione synthase/RimK-type ligase-like ATP-grasp enzyme
MEQFRADETDALTHGLLWSHPTVWVNDPGRERTAGEKLVQLAAAAACGLDVPDTIVTNEPEAARAFIDRVAPAPVVVKRVSATPGLFVETRIVTPEVRARLDALRACPAILQSYVEGVADIRLTWMAGETRCVRIDSPAGAGRVDSRLDLSVAFAPHALPVDVARGLGALMEALGLVFGVIDLRLDADGRYWFLEVNPQGQFAYLELRSGLPFVEPFARFLAACASGGRAAMPA